GSELKTLACRPGGSVTGGGIDQDATGFTRDFAQAHARCVVSGIRGVVRAASAAQGEDLNALSLYPRLFHLKAFAASNIRHRAHDDGSGDWQLYQSALQTKEAAHGTRSRRQRRMGAWPWRCWRRIVHGAQGSGHRLVQGNADGSLDFFRGDCG